MEGEANKWRDLTGRSPTFSLGTSGTASMLKSFMAEREDEILAEIIGEQRAAMLKDENDKDHLPLGDIRAWNKWFAKFPQQYAKKVREAYESMSGQRASEITAAQTKKTFDQAQTDRTTEAAYEATGEEANALLNRIKDQYTTHKPGRQQLGKAQAIDKLTSGLIELGIKGKDLSSYTARLESVIKLTEEMRAGKVNKTAGRYATEIIKGLEDETYDYVQAMSEFSRLTAGLDPSSAGVTAARTALTKHIDAMKYTEETLAVVLRTGPNAGMMDFVTKKQLLEDLAREPDKRLYVAPQGKSDLPPGMSIVAWMVVDDAGKQIIPNHFIQKMALEGYSRLWALDEKERAWWNAWVEKYKETNPSIMEQLAKFALGAQGAGGSSTGVGAVTVTEQ
tara:strand:- start:165 stop:1343 length:1179 start_codon:yes stop_codon:yes gene_type:complete